jgi:hypothetical protein
MIVITAHQDSGLILNRVVFLIAGMEELLGPKDPEIAAMYPAISVQEQLSLNAISASLGTLEMVILICNSVNLE